MVNAIFWVAFHLVIIAMIVWDLRTRKGEKTFRENINTIIFTVAIGLIFGIYISYSFGSVEGIKYYTAYFMELALSVDNLFVFMIIFTYFAVPVEYQHKTLFYGVLGAIMFRAIFLFLGVSLLDRFHFIQYFFGAILLFSAYKLLKGGVKKTNPSDNPVLRLAKRFLPLSDSYKDGKFVMTVNGRLLFSPLIVVLLVIETTDIMFAFDSVPAVLTITDEFFTAYTSNIMAILGLRALFFVVDQVMEKIKYLSTGLALVLAYLGLKTFGTYFGINIPTLWNMGIVLGTIGSFILLSLVKNHQSSSNENR